MAGPPTTPPSALGQALDPEASFLCGFAVDDETRDHVFPKWLLNRHGFWNARMTLTNGSITAPFLRELTLAVDRRTKQSRTIVSDDILRGYAVHHPLLRRILGKVTSNASLGRIFIFDAMDSTHSVG